MRRSEYNKKIVNDICLLISNDSYTIEEICKIVGIDDSTYYRWQASKPEFCEAIKTAKGKYDDIVISEAKKSLLKKLKGYDIEERSTEVEVDVNGEPKPSKIKTITKYIQPDTTAIIFTLTNKVPEEYQNKYNAEISGKGGKDLIPENIKLTTEQIDALIDKIEAK